MHAVHKAGGRRRPRGRWVLPLIAAGAVALAAAPASAVVQHDHLSEQRYADLDVRKDKLAPMAAQRDIVRELDARARWNEFGTPQSLIRDGGFLAWGVQAEDAEAAARAFVADNRALFRLSSLDTLELVNDAKIGDAGHAVVFRQRYDGIPATAGGTLNVGVKRAGAGWQVAYVSSTLSGDEAMSAATDLSEAEAFAAAADSVGVSTSIAQLRDAGQKAGWTRLDPAGARPPGLVRKVAFPTAERGAVTAYEVYVDRTATESYRQIVDGRTGDVLFRESATDNLADDPFWKDFPAYSHSALDTYPWNYPSADGRDMWCWTGDGNESPGEACKLAVGNPASKVEWDKDARTNQPTFTTIGNNARAGENWQSSSEPQPDQYRPTSATRDYVYPWTNAWFETKCSPTNFTPGGNDIDAAATNLFAMHNRMHDWAYHLGFTEQNWNGQDFNHGVRTEGERDPVIGNVQAGGVTGGAPTYSGRDNANMNTRPDGTSSRTNMYLWQPIAGTFYAPCVDGDYDMSVIGHEYGHMIENRMIGKGNRRQGFHAGAMGESAGDLMATEYLNEWNFVPVGGGDNPTGGDADSALVGRYVTGNDDRGIRNYDMSFASAGKFPEPGVYPHVNPLNFSDVGYDITGPQVHADGEIWSATNFDLKELLTQRYPSNGANVNRECANGERPAQACPGNRRWAQIMFDSFLLMPVGPTFLDARDAQLAADVLRFGGANQDLLWRGFARRGFGQNASTINNNDTDPVPDFESPREEEATVTFEATAKDEGGQPVQARIYVGHYEARVSPVADTDPATTGSVNADNVARFVPDDGGNDSQSRQRAYEFVAHARGYGHVRFRLNDLKAGENRTVRIEFPTNWASRYKGATASGDGVRHEELIDDTEDTNWESTGAPARGRQVLIRLPGPQRIERVKASAMLLFEIPGDRPQDPPRRPGQNRFTALRSFEVLACRAGADAGNATCNPANAAGFKRIMRSEDDAFPAMPPRPAAPDLTLRTWSAATTTATHVLFRVLDNQCTGQEAFQGEQDNDPANNTDCRTGGPLPGRANEVRAAELQLQSSKPTVVGAQVAD